jgi:hypothetical protein
MAHGIAFPPLLDPGAACTHGDTTARFLRALSDPTRLRCWSPSSAANARPRNVLRMPGLHRPACRCIFHGSPTVDMLRVGTGASCAIRSVTRGWPT